MNSITPVLDLHCDTITNGLGRHYDLADGIARFDLGKIPDEFRWCQTCAIFIPDEYRGQAAVDYYERAREHFQRQLELYPQRIGQARTMTQAEALLEEGKTAAILSVEGGAALGGRLEMVQKLWDDGVRMMTLTWNGENEIGGGAATDQGLKDFGVEVIREMERLGMLVDVSHLNEKTFWQVVEKSEKPFLATHSNSRKVWDHRRNLTDDQFRALAERGGIVGINFCREFLAEDPDPTAEQMVRHIWHFLELGGEQCVSLGSDSDGAIMPSFLDSLSGVAVLRDAMLQSGLGEELTGKILYGNARDFLRRTLG